MDLQAIATALAVLFNGGFLLFVIRMQNARTKEKVDMDYCLQQHKRVDEAIDRNNERYGRLMSEISTLRESLNDVKNLFTRLDERLKILLNDHKGDSK